MKYPNVKAFEKHLTDGSPLCRLYLIAIPDDFERGKTIDTLLLRLGSSPLRLSGADADLRACLDAMQSMSLFGESVVVIDEIEKFSKKQQQTLSDSLASSSSYILFGARAKTVLAPLIEKEGTLLDLLEEKPWDKEKRLMEQLQSAANRAGKRLASDVPHLLLERLGADPALLMSEVDKLICYAGDRPLINAEDVLQISPLSKGSTLWQTAEEVIWEKGEFPSMDTTSFHALVPALRSQLHLGLTLATLIEEKCPPDQWNRYLPKLWPKILEKRSSQAAHLGAPYFRKGLEKLFDLELASRTHSTQYRALLDLFRAQIHAR